MTERELLHQAWIEYCEQLPSEDLTPKKRWHTQKRSRASDQTILSLQIYGVKDVVSAIEDARTMWMKKDRLAGGKAQQLFHKFCGTLDAHSAILKMFPSEDKYISVFCGSLKMLVQVSPPC